MRVIVLLHGQKTSIRLLRHISESAGEEKVARHDLVSNHPLPVLQKKCSRSYLAGARKTALLSEGAQRDIVAVVFVYDVQTRPRGYCVISPDGGLCVVELELRGSGEGVAWSDDITGGHVCKVND